jgi:hypothetical protein
MRLSMEGRFGLVVAVSLASAAGSMSSAWAQGDDPAGDDDDSGAEEAAPKEGIEGGGFDDYETAEAKKKAEIEPEYGLGVRVRTVFVPKPILELFVEEASGGVFQPGFGLELSRRKGNFELVLGLEYESLSPDDGFWLDKGDDPNDPEETPDFLEFNDLAWVTADIAFIFNAALTESLSFRYGAGLGIGVVLGEVLQTDSTCTPGTDDIQEDCTPDQTGAPGRQLNDPADLPPVFPVVDLIVGLQFRPIDKLTLNVETGIRTVGFFGVSSTYYF